MALIGWVLARSVTRPVGQLQRAAERFASGDLRRDDDVTVGGPPELQALAATLSTMATRLALVLEEQRSFVADASHQLRTPLTALRLRLENLQSTVPEAGAAELDAAIEETDRLGRLVGDLLQLARTDQLPDPVLADLAAIAGERADTWSAVADAAAVTLGWRPPAPGERTVVQAVAGAIEQILDNVIDNAVAASAHGGTVTVTVRVVPGPRPVELAVIDHGPGLSDYDKLRALRRFWRNDAGRDGSGLGLPIAVALAEASGATLRLADTPGGGLTVVVAFTAAR
jgi:signal transduction histidine kinase